MTWADLYGVLRDRGLVKADSGLPGNPTATFVTGVADDSVSSNRAMSLSP
jgi:hypothetical protein